MKILITGGAGYLGSIMTPHLLGLGHEVTVLDNFLFRQNSLADCCHYDTFNIVRGDGRGEATFEGCGCHYPARSTRWGANV